MENVRRTEILVSNIGWYKKTLINTFFVLFYIYLIIFLIKRCPDPHKKLWLMVEALCRSYNLARIMTSRCKPIIGVINSIVAFKIIPIIISIADLGKCKPFIA